MSAPTSTTNSPRNDSAAHDSSSLYQMGYQARWQGATLAACPFESGTRYYVEWIRGWIQSQIDRRKE